MLLVPLVIAIVAALLLGLGAIVDDRRLRSKHVASMLLPVEAVVPLIHSINDDRCIGCEACIDVCPTEVLDLVDHKVKVSRFSDCVQCEQCQNSCPTMALVMFREGTTPRMLTVPELDEHFQTGVPGQYLIGEVAGKPLVKNAANLGRAVIEHVVKELAAEPARGADVLDVAIVGSGPGGLSAGLTCVKRGLRCIVLEKEHVISSTVSRYPKGKHFMAEPATSPNVSFLPVFDGSKEELVEAWQPGRRRREAADQARRGRRDRGARRGRRVLDQVHRRDVSRATRGARDRPARQAPSAGGARREPQEGPVAARRPGGVGRHGRTRGRRRRLRGRGRDVTRRRRCAGRAVVSRRRIQALQAGQPEAARRDDLGRQAPGRSSSRTSRSSPSTRSGSSSRMARSRPIRTSARSC